MKIKHFLGTAKVLSCLVVLLLSLSLVWSIRCPIMLFATAILIPFLQVVAMIVRDYHDRSAVSIGTLMCLVYLAGYSSIMGSTGSDFITSTTVGVGLFIIAIVYAVINIVLLRSLGWTNVGLQRLCAGMAIVLAVGLLAVMEWTYNRVLDAREGRFLVENPDYVIPSSSDMVAYAGLAEQIQDDQVYDNGQYWFITDDALFRCHVSVMRQSDGKLLLNYLKQYGVSAVKRGSLTPDELRGLLQISAD